MTNDGATILKSIGVDNPAAKVLVDIAKGMDDEVGDGTTSVTVLGNNLFLAIQFKRMCNFFLLGKLSLNFSEVFVIDKQKIDFVTEA